MTFFLFRIFFYDHEVVIGFAGETFLWRQKTRPSAHARGLCFLNISKDVLRLAFLYVLKYYIDIIIIYCCLGNNLKFYIES